MSKPRYIWWSYAKKMAQQYPDLQKQEEQLQKQNYVFALDGMPKKKKIADPTADAVTRQLAPDKAAELDAVRKAIEETQRKPNGNDRMQVVHDVLFTQRYTIAGAAMRVPCSERTAKEWHRDFVRLVAKYRGLM